MATADSNSPSPVKRIDNRGAAAALAIDPDLSAQRSASAASGKSNTRPRGGLWAVAERALTHLVGRAALVCLAGTLLFLACADFDIWPLAWIGVVPLFFVLLDEHGAPREGTGWQRSPLFLGFLCGLVANGGGFYWIVGLLMRFGHLPFIAALPIFLLLVAYQAITFALFAALLCHLAAQLDVAITLLAPLCWVACELCVPYVFPWYLAITQAWVPPVIQIAELTGPLGVSFLLVLSSAAIYDVLCAWRRHGGRPPGSALVAPLCAAVLLVANVGYGYLRIHQVQGARAAAPKVNIGVVQANIGINEKFVPGLRENQLAVHQRLSQELERRGADLIVWPESSYPYPLRRPVQGDFPEGHPAQARRGFSKPLLFGALTVQADPGQRPVPYNTAVLYDKDGRTTGTFDKNFLLVFGEYLPYAEKLAFLREWIPEISNFARGTSTTTFPFDFQGKRYQLGPMICYEDIIPAFGRRLFDTPTPPNLIINITNDAWFGATSEPWEHMALSVYRAIEHRVDMVRAVNTGVSVFIDATGRVYDKGPSVDPQLTPGVQPVTLLNQAALLEPTGLFQRLGETFGGACLGAVLLLSVLARRRAGWPVRWSWLLGGAAKLHGLVLLVGLLWPGVTLAEVYAALAHRNEAQFSDEALFRATTALLLVLLVASAALGAMLTRLALREQGAHTDHESRSGSAVIDQEGRVLGRLEALWAVVLTTVAPVVLCGRMEGNTGSVVILTLLCTSAALLAGRVVRRRARR